MDINIIGVPVKYGCDKDGPQYGPDKIRENGIVEILENSNHKVFDLGNLYIPYKSQEDKFDSHSNIKYFDEIININNNLAHLVYCSLKASNFPLVIGGDHSLGLGSISGASREFKDLAVVWIDAHGDINTIETSPTGNSHGMPLAAAMGVGEEEMVNLYYKGQKIKPENVYIIGARDLDKGEILLAKELDLNLYTMDEIRKKGLDNIIIDIVEKLKLSNIDGLHLSFDIDVLDKTLVPGTGTPVINGFQFHEAKEILEILFGTKLVTSMDLVELNPSIDTDDKTSKITMAIIDIVSKNL